MSMSDVNHLSSCEFCHELGGELIWQNSQCRVVLIDDIDYVGFCRVILNQHVKEMSDLDSSQQWALMQIVFLVEQIQREILQPDKINLASLGNKTPHLHWHVIPRFVSDKNFPEATWGPQQRAGKSADYGLLTKFKQRLLAQLKQQFY